MAVRVVMGIRSCLRRLSRVRVSASMTWRKPPVFESKMLCLSLLYLVSTVSLCLYASFSRTPCVWRLLLLPFGAVTAGRVPQQVLVQYPPGYAPYKHALPAATSSCDSPLIFPDYGSAYDDIRRLCLEDASPRSDNSTPRSTTEDGGLIAYMTAGDGTSTTFGGNLSSDERKSYFDLSRRRGEQGRTPIPCGFLKEFPISEADRAAMGTCKGVVVLSALFGDHDKIRQPMGLGPWTLATVCFFMFVDDATIHSLRAQKVLPRSPQHQQSGSPPSPIILGAWRLVRVAGDRLPYADPAMNGVIPKHLPHRLFPDARFSVWVDAKLQLTVDPLLLLHSLLVATGDGVEVDMAISKHPFNVHTMEEVVATARWRKWADIRGLRTQMETYCRNGLQPWSTEKLPYTTDVPDTALILRRHGPRTDHFSCLLFNELDAFNHRDQLAFAYIRDLMNPKIKIHMFDVDTFEQVTVEYRHNLKQSAAAAGKSGKKKKKNRRMSGDATGFSWDISNSSCRRWSLLANRHQAEVAIRRRLIANTFMRLPFGRCLAIAWKLKRD